ncbi:MAG: hypothetical protein AMS25_15040 [Gemmatimonas sp. SM23_52]|nr:MAG: hypothetical protein AMS25_15040 [Gemmatimonas sp. SM23_52]
MTDQPIDSATAPFRVCGSCEKQWASSYDFVVDPEVRLLGLQMVPKSPKGNLLVFGHRCGTSISVFAKRLGDLLADPDDDDADPDPVVSYEECKRHCPKVEDLAVCDRLCPRAADRRLVRAIFELKRGSK